MIETPLARRKRRFKTESGYKLRGAMVWVVVGILAGVLMALAAFGTALASNAIWSQFNSLFYSCADRGIANELFDAFHAVAFFIAFGFLLLFVRRAVVRWTTPRYQEFAEDVGNWFGFGSVLAYVVCGVPLAIVAVFNGACS